MAPTTSTGRAWQRMLSGRRLDLLDPSPLDVEIEDIAHGLARVARWNGQTRGDHAFSVAQHCLLVEALLADRGPALDRRWRLAGLLHDAPEYVIGDMISPFKAAVGIDYKAFEARLLAAIHLRFGLPAAPPAKIQSLIKRADRTAAFLEATELAGFELEEARKYFGTPPEVFGRREPVGPPPRATCPQRRFGAVLAKIPATQLAPFPAKWNHFADEKLRQLQCLSIRFDQAGFGVHLRRSLRRALARMRSLRMIAVMATLGAFPAAISI